jgi:hypothetical protein
MLLCFRLRAIALTATALASFGCSHWHPHTRKESMRSTLDAPLPVAPDSAPLPIAMTAAQQDLPEITDEVLVQPLYDLQSRRSFSMRYYQATPTLSDLFADPSTPSSSMLCWPTVMAYEMDYQRNHRRLPLPKLTAIPPASESAADQKAAASVRSLAKLCETDSRVGTTAPQAATCLAKFYESSGYRADLTIIGNDSQWATSGLYPAGTKAEHRPATPQDLRAALNADKSVILLVGFYRLNAVDQQWERLRGHFVSITGYSYRRTWLEEEMTLTLANPAVLYTGDQASSTVKMRLLAHQIINEGLPDNATYTLRGPNISGETFTTMIETAMVFDGVTPPLN